jgi:hypothetical protein
MKVTTDVSMQAVPSMRSAIQRLSSEKGGEFDSQLETSSYRTGTPDAAIRRAAIVARRVFLPA